jgi:hypothetical protein
MQKTKATMPTAELLSFEQRMKDQAQMVKNQMDVVLSANAYIEDLEAKLEKAKTERNRAKYKVDVEMTVLKRLMMEAALKEGADSFLNLTVSVNWNYAADIFGIKKPKWGGDKD